MKPNSVQATNAVVVIRPHYFRPNEVTAQDNAFQKTDAQANAAEISKRALIEVNGLISKLREHDIRVHDFDDKSDQTPDSVFPNNWFSTHAGGHVAIYPMYPENRRIERRSDVIEMLKTEYRVQDVIDYSGLEADGLFLEGTGAMVLDHMERVAYAVQSNRTDPIALERFCAHFNYEPMVFEACDVNGVPVYHTNVLMCIATDFVLIGLDMIADEKRKNEIIERFEKSGRAIIALSNDQISSFAGNAIELFNKERRVLALSQTAFDCLSEDQIKVIEQSATPLPLAIPTIELAGGSVRCMLAGIHLSKR
jgi:hypothetical protein